MRFVLVAGITMLLIFTISLPLHKLVRKLSVKSILSRREILGISAISIPLGDIWRTLDAVTNRLKRCPYVVLSSPPITQPEQSHVLTTRPRSTILQTC